MVKYFIDGRFTVRNFGGQERFAYELLKELDEIVDGYDISLVVPLYSTKIDKYTNIKVVKYGKHKKGLLWEQIDFYKYVTKHKGIGIYLLNTWSIITPNIVTIHDMSVFDIPKMYKNIYGILSVKYHRLLYYIAAKKAEKIITVSEFSKDRISKILKVDRDKIFVIGNGWQHVNRIKEDFTVFDKHPEICKGKYFFSVSSLTPQKNFKWVKENAFFNLQNMYVIAGEKIKLSNEKLDEYPSNVLFLGRVEDGEMKALMNNCKAFIHPAIYEGFGITPMEALSVGAKVIVSNASCLPEIYADSVYYVDPYNCKINLDELLSENVESADEVLNKYSWKTSAYLFKRLILEGDLKLDEK